MKNEAERAASFAINLAKRRQSELVSADDLLVGCLLAISEFGVALLGEWTVDLEGLGVDWQQTEAWAEKTAWEEKTAAGPAVAYSDRVVELFDRAARVSRARSGSGISVEDLLAVFADQDDGVMGTLKRTLGITSASWRGALARRLRSTQRGAGETRRAGSDGQEYLTPEAAAAALSVHVQTMRAYIRSGKLPAHRLAGERAIRIRRSDLTELLEPLLPAAGAE